MSDAPASEDILPLSSPDALKALQSATRGLLFPSESDKPIKALVWKKKDDSVADAILTPNVLIAFGVTAADTTVSEMTVDTIFAPLTAEESWYGPDEKATAQKYHLLASLLGRLQGAKAFRVAMADARKPVLIYALGYTSDGDLAGISTESVET